MGLMRSRVTAGGTIAADTQDREQQQDSRYSNNSTFVLVCLHRQRHRVVAVAGDCRGHDGCRHTTEGATAAHVRSSRVAQCNTCERCSKQAMLLVTLYK
jgi:hypothetical protein